MDMEQIRFDLDKQHACLFDVCGFLLDADRPQQNDGLSNIAEGSSLPQLSRALKRVGAPFQTKGRRRQKSKQVLPVVASAAELVEIIHELITHYSRVGMRGMASKKILVLSKRSDELVASFHTAFPGLWGKCDIQQLFTSSQPPASNHMSDINRQVFGVSQHILWDDSEASHISHVYYEKNQFAQCRNTCEYPSTCMSCLVDIDSALEL
jgi:hypothetical protein